MSKPPIQFSAKSVKSGNRYSWGCAFFTEYPGTYNVKAVAEDDIDSKYKSLSIPTLVTNKLHEKGTGFLNVYLSNDAETVELFIEDAKKHLAILREKANTK